MRQLSILWIILVSLPLAVFAQTAIDLKAQSRNVDFGSAASTRPIKTGDALPAACSTGEMFFVRLVQRGKNLYGCTATNTWTLLAPVFSDAAPASGDLARWDTDAGKWSPAPTDSLVGVGLNTIGGILEIDGAVVPKYSLGNGAPSVNCTAGAEFYTDTVNGDLYFCRSANTWQIVSSSAHQHDAGAIATGTMSLARGGTGADLSATGGPSGVLQQVVAGGPVTVSQLTAADISGLAASATTDTTNAANLASGVVALARGGAGADLSATGGPSSVLQQVVAGGPVTVSQLTAADISGLAASATTDTTNAANLASGVVALARGGTNASAWTAGRCVQVSADGTKLESAPDSCGGGTQTIPDSTDPSMILVDDEFVSGDTVSGRVGALGWWHTNIGSAPTYSQAAGSWPNLGVLKVTTAATHGAGFEFKPGSSNAFGALGVNTSWTLTFVFRAGQAVNQRLRVGAFPNALGTAEPTYGLWMCCDASSGFGDANWQFETRSSSVSTVTDSGAACDADWHVLRIYSAASGSVTFKLDSGAGGRTSTITQTLPSGVLTVGAILVVDQSSGATAKHIDIDKISFKATGLSR